MIGEETTHTRCCTYLLNKALFQLGRSHVAVYERRCIIAASTSAFWFSFYYVIYVYLTAAGSRTGRAGSNAYLALGGPVKPVKVGVRNTYHKMTK